MVNMKLLELRKKMSKNRPKFLRQDYHHRMKVQDDLWRAPKGRHSKMRQNIHGHRAWISIGYRGPAEVRGLHKSGAEFVRIENLQQLIAVDPKKSVVILSAKVGAKKRYELLKKAVEKNITVVNINAKKFVADFDARMKAKKEAKTAKPKEEAKKAEAKPKAAVKPEIKAETKTASKQITSPKFETKKTQEDKFGA